MIVYTNICIDAMMSTVYNGVKCSMVWETTKEKATKRNTSVFVCVCVHE